MQDERLTTEHLRQLSLPFSTKQIHWKPGATTRDKDRALALAYADPRHYQQRLDDVLGTNWSDSYEVHNGGELFICYLRLGGVTRSDVGEKEGGDQNTATSAKAQAFKRACVAFGLGRYLYTFPQKWVAYDVQRKRFTDGGLAELTAHAVSYHQLLANESNRQPKRESDSGQTGQNAGGERQPAGDRPYSPETIRDKIRTYAEWQNGSRLDGEPATEGQVKSVGSLMGESVRLQGMKQADLDKSRYQVLGYLVGVDSSSKLTKREASAIINWLKEEESWDLNEWAAKEAAQIIEALAVDAGQQTMEM